MTGCEEEQRGTRPHAVDLSSASESGTYAGTGTQAGDLTALRVVIAFGVDELTNPYVRYEVFEDQDEGSQSRKEKRTPVQLLLALTIFKIRNNSFIFVTFFSFQTKVSPLLRAALAGHFAVPCAKKCCNTLEQWIPYFGANFRCQFTITSGMYGNQFLL